ncbi:unnamed protein product [Cuscuta campestris]|uniref:Uncharacterized protein n=1 Tax=Cuscuta campestris TaxID=132261 RepID=A0A484LTA9_9ASTE|nr:unnamed protein product [Cuscuta campestris]
MELFPSGKNHSDNKTVPKLILPLFLTVVVLAAFPLYYTFNRAPTVHELDLFLSTSPDGGTGPEPSRNSKAAAPAAEIARRCDISTGDWVPDPTAAPSYSNETCWEIQETQNCKKFGQPDNGYLRWRWKPDGCELPVFDPVEFLELVRGKALAFVGDSIARNHMQSLVCLLSRITYPSDISNTDNRRSLVYRDYDFNITLFWSPYLVKTGVTYSESNKDNPFDLYLDEFDESWTTKIKDFDYLIINAGHWFFRPTRFYLEGKLVGCLYSWDPNVTQLTSGFSYRRALKTAFRAVKSNFKGVAFLRTFTPQHYENGPWDSGGECARTEPLRRNDSAALAQFKFDVYDIQREEFGVAEEEGRRNSDGVVRLRLFDVTQAMLLRPDGHPNRYGHPQNPNITYHNDCIHWCLPGPIDTWGDFFMELLKREVIDPR